MVRRHHLINYYQLNSKQFGTGGSQQKQATYIYTKDDIYNTDINTASSRARSLPQGMAPGVDRTYEIKARNNNVARWTVGVTAITRGDDDGGDGVMSARESGNLDDCDSNNSSIRNGKLEQKYQQQSISKLSAIACLPMTKETRKRQGSNGRTAKRDHEG